MCYEPRKEALRWLTNYVVADVYFFKLIFVNGVLDMGLHVISCFRDDAYFRYLINDKPTSGKGPPKLYDGKIDIKYSEENCFEIIPLKDRQARILPAIVHTRSLKRNIRLYIW